jgi:hypothetical protein
MRLYIPGWLIPLDGRMLILVKQVKFQGPLGRGKKESNKKLSSNLCWLLLLPYYSTVELLKKKI